MKYLGLLVPLIAAAVTLAGVRLYSNGLLIISPSGGTYSAFLHGAQTVYEEPPMLSPQSDAERWDFDGEVYVELKNLDAEIIKTEIVGEVTVIYAYTPRLVKSVNLDAGKVNIMAAIGNGSCIGYPLLCGSY